MDTEKPPLRILGRKSRAPSSTGETPHNSLTHTQTVITLFHPGELLSFVDSFVYSFVCSVVEYPLCVCHCSFLFSFYLAVLGLNSSGILAASCKIFWLLWTPQAIALKLQQLRHVGLVAPWLRGIQFTARDQTTSPAFAAGYHWLLGSPLLLFLTFFFHFFSVTICSRNTPLCVLRVTRIWKTHW